MASNALQPDKTMTGYDRLSLILVAEPKTYIQKLAVRVNLPGAVSNESLHQRVYAIHGVSNAEFTHPLPGLLVYQATELSPFSVFTIEAKWPRGLIHYSFLTRILLFIQSASLTIWLAIGFGLTVFAFVIFFHMLYLQKRDRKKLPRGYLEHPPENLPPALVGVLCRGRVSEREIAATILDLAQRGFIDITQKRDEYVLGKREGKDTLRPFELFLYDKLFTQKGERKIKRTEFEIEERAAQQFYSAEITDFYRALYQEIQQRGYFLKNPGWVILKYRTVGVLLFLLAVAIALLSTRFSAGPPYAIIGSFGEVIAAFLIIKTAPLMPKRTKEGQKALFLWLSFGQYLADPKPLSALSSSQGLFERYLPYAVALGLELPWVSRFSNTLFIPPSWYSSFSDTTIENFTASLFYVTGSLSKTLYGLKEPTL